MKNRSEIDALIELTQILFNRTENTTAEYSEMIGQLETILKTHPDYKQREIHSLLGALFFLRAAKYEDEKYMQSALESYQEALKYLSEKFKSVRDVCEQKIKTITPGQALKIIFTSELKSKNTVIKPKTETMEETAKRLMKEFKAYKSTFSKVSKKM
jgi:tetratricopeptide (TPR) repeat protein